MSLHLFNSLTRRVEPFVPADPARVTMYVCGPTVYNYVHIGNARPYVVFGVLADLLRRRYGALSYARNVTDVDDKINNAAREQGVPIEGINKVQDGSPHVVDALRAGRIQLVINTPKGSGAHQDSFPLRRTALESRVPYFTTIAGAAAAAAGIEYLQRGALAVRSLQEHHGRAG